MTGWNAPEPLPYLEKSIKASSLNFFGKEAMHIGEGGSIPLMN